MNRMLLGGAMMATLTVLKIVGTVVPAWAADNMTLDGELQPFLGEPKFEMRRLFEGERFPNVVVARDGTVLATWGSKRVRVRRSEDGGKTWGPEIAIGDGIHGGGAIVDERRGDVLVFTHPEHPPRDGQTAPRTVCCSTDHGKTWQEAEATFHKDVQSFVPSLHMMEHGTTLLRGPHAGRLIRPARVYRSSPERYAMAIFSDDAGRNWHAGKPFAELGTGEAALVELSDGRLLGTARKSYFAADEPLRHERVFAYSDDGGVTWRDAFHAKAIPDGPRYRGTERRGANYNGHFGMFNGLTRLPVAGRDILIYSNADHDGHERIRMTVWASFDGGKSWPAKRLVHEGLSAYSSLAAGRPGTPSEGWIYLQFEHGEGKQQYAGCQIARFNLAWLLAGEPTDDGRLPDWVGAGVFSLYRFRPIFALLERDGFCSPLAGPLSLESLMPVPGTRNDENGIMMVAGRRGVLVIAAPPRRKVPPLVRGGGDCASPCAGFSEQWGGLTPLWLCLSFSQFLQQLSCKTQGCRKTKAASSHRTPNGLKPCQEVLHRTKTGSRRLALTSTN